MPKLLSVAISELEIVSTYETAFLQITV